MAARAYLANTYKFVHKATITKVSLDPAFLLLSSTIFHPQVPTAPAARFMCSDTSPILTAPAPLGGVHQSSLLRHDRHIQAVLLLSAYLVACPEAQQAGCLSGSLYWLFGAHRVEDSRRTLAKSSLLGVTMPAPLMFQCVRSTET